MSEEKKEAFLHRWSRLKHEDRKEVPAQQENPAPELPAVDKLTPESDFSGFMHPKVEDTLRRVALKKLFSDPHFNIPDPYEPFSGDWNLSEPISEELLATLNQARQHLFSEKKDEPAEKPAEGLAEQKPEGEEPGKQDA